MTEREKFETWYNNQYAGEGYDEALATFERSERIYKKIITEQQQHITALTDSRDNATKMLKTVLQMLDNKTCL